MRVGVLPNLDKRGSSETVEKLGKFLKAEGIEALLPDHICSPDFIAADEQTLFRTSDVIITIGGDGTIIRYAKKAAENGKPILGINAGRMGYLANMEQNEIRLLSRLKTGQYQIEPRMMLRARIVEDGRVLGDHAALNDLVISSGFISKIVDISVSVSGDAVNYRADGLILSTPTGSTAYSMSAGGPVIDPATECICITPICSHSLSAKPILLGADKEIRLRAYSKKRTEIFLTVDGRKVAAVKPHTEVIITKAEKAAQFLRINDRSFYKTLAYKFADSRSVYNEKQETGKNSGAYKRKNHPHAG